MDPVSLTEDQLEALAWVSVDYFLKEVNHHNGLIRDKTQDGAPASIAAVAMALATAPLAVESGGAPRAFMARRTLNRLRFFWNSPQGTQPDATGYKGFYYHFLDMESGRRVWDCELSTVDSAFLLAGMLTVATYFDQENAIRNPLEFEEYGPFCWGLTASDGPGWTTRVVNGIERRFFDYIARGAPYGPDDGTIAPWAVVASLPFAPEIVLPTIKHFDALDLGMLQPYGFKATFNRTFPVAGSPVGWVSPYHFGIVPGPVAT